MSDSETTVTNGKESDIKTLLADWDDSMGRALSFDAPAPDEIIPRDENEIREFESRIETLETENGDLTERVEKSEGMAEFVDEAATRIDQHDFDRTVEKIASETGISKRIIEMEIKQRIIEDEDFAAAADDRFDNPDRLKSMVANLTDDLSDMYPQREDDHGLGAAVRMSRSVGGVISTDDHSYGDMANMNTAEFDAVSKRIFEDAKTGKLRSPKRRGGGYQTTSAPGL